MRRVALATALAAVLTVGGCADEPGPPENPLGSAGQSSGQQSSRQQSSGHPDVGTATLRRAKESAGIAPCPSSDADAAAVDGGLPAVSLPCLGGGREVHMAGLPRRPLVLNLWASWCTPCREELPVLQRFHERAGHRVAVLGVDFEDTQPAAALELLRRSGVTYPQVSDFGKDLDAGLGRHPVPMTVLVDRDGTVVSKLPMQITSADQLAGYVRQSLGVDL